MTLRLLILAVALVVTVACAAPATPIAPPTPTSMPEPSPAANEPTVGTSASQTPAPSSTPPPTSTPPVSPTPQPTVPPVDTSTLAFSGAEAMAHALAQCEIGPRPAGSEGLLATRDYIESVLVANGWEVVRQDREFMGVPIHNVIGVKGEGTPRMLGAHFDTRPVADMDPDTPTEPIIGGNDGASGVAVLLELSRILEIPEGRQVQLAFFDAEDRGNLEGWPFSVGARFVATELPVDRPEAMVLLDMIGDADQQIFREQNSTQSLNDTIFGIAAALGYEDNSFYNRGKYIIIDDHLPFIEVGIPAIDLIDFDYPYWHTVEDTCDKLGEASLERVGRVVEVWIEQQGGQ
jgi:glutaminyl-peptide cyclotransferase